MKHYQYIFGIALTVGLVGCVGNPTNAPSEQSVVESNASREAAIDADDSLTPEGKEQLKSALRNRGPAQTR